MERVRLASEVLAKQNRDMYRAGCDPGRPGQILGGATNAPGCAHRRPHIAEVAPVRERETAALLASETVRTMLLRNPFVPSFCP